MKNSKLILFFLLLISVSCKKEIVDPPSADPVFTFAGDVDGTQKNYKAGENDYYLYSSFYHDANNVYNFDSHLKKYECISCTDDIQIILIDYQTSAAGDPINMNISVTPGYYPIGITGGAPKSTDITFNAQVSGPSTSYFWDFGDGNTQTAAPGSITHTYNRHGKYQVCLTVTFSSGPTSTICNEVNVETPDNAIDYFFTANAVTGNDVDFSPLQQSGTAVTYQWDLGDGNTSSSSTLFTHTYSAPGIYLVKLTVTDANGHQSVFSRNVKTFGFVSNVANFFDVTASSNNPNPLGLTNVIINYTDENGITYSTLNTTGAGYFRILTVEDYSPNENGYPTKKITAEFKCDVSDGTTSKLIENARVVFAFAYQ